MPGPAAAAGGGGGGGRGDLPPTKTIVVYKNGDAFFPGRKIVMNPRYLSTFDSFLTSLSRGREAPFGAVRKLYTPRDGHKVQQLDDLKHGSVYVAAGCERFKKLDYCEITTKKPQKKKKEQIRPVVHSRIVVSARWRRTNDESCTINVFTNGDVLVAPARIRIPKYTLRSWENVLAMVTGKVRLRTGAVYRLCTLDGRPVCGPTELENNQYYVAVGAEKFKALPYDHCDPCRDVMRENNTIEGQDILPAIRKTRHPKDVFAHTGFGEDLEHTARGQMKKQAKPERTKQQRQVSRNPVLFSTGEGSVFNARNKRSEMAGAAEVQDDRQLKVDLPIDQVEAKIVDEEYEDGSCFASPCKASLHDSDSLCLQRSLSAGSRKDRSLSSGQGDTGAGHRTGDTGLKTPGPKEAKEREVSSRLGRIRSRVSRFLKEKVKH
ncbi:doublecortin domain-containing protein 2 isoform X2 [Sebastes umbrosus]|uniref:doublecortin domain-containing protein 2 isoform X2 n=1 Tax=Sebastes umbrosus TaxID=72105 RepID=UPI00189ECF20|nr:doublecortin domain-containing protein 2 isoform X2 [Sebastes umbrosus]XP_037603323.1 doublecortin domain-containing protein 2 isoform X2 [Sebastes umbrosus]XP_037603324.1 doublecortin domain-containing protein 2 isoform X2 [Sebastes umbrosus]XP_037603325.1 doublecortin domain-containing protein 2 isoform X2 [Sebastes umbrosus]XP_037603327.1 doublecortin domain-containing protein 2 isoform X2 [Sebastes umbrosus]